MAGTVSIYTMLYHLHQYTHHADKAQCMHVWTCLRCQLSMQALAWYVSSIQCNMFLAE